MTMIYRQECIPAGLGWSAIIPLHGEDGKVEGIHREPIIGWVLEWSVEGEEGSGGLHEVFGSFPVITGYGERIKVIESPDGRLSSPGDEWFEDIAAVLVFFRKEK